MKKQKHIVVVSALVVLAAVYWYRAHPGVPEPSEGREILSETLAPRTANKRPASQPNTLPRQPEPQKGHQSLTDFSDVIAERKTEEWMTVSARVIKILPDDNIGSRHQRFLVEGREGNTILVAHNIDLAKSIPIERRDVLEIRGRYEWNVKGGVLHWTHNDPSGRLEGGWILHRGVKYR